MQKREKSIIKPKNPMDPNNNTWDYTIEERIKLLEEKITNLEVNILDIFKAILGEIEEEKKEQEKEKEKKKDEEIEVEKK